MVALEKARSDLRIPIGIERSKSMLVIRKHLIVLAVLAFPLLSYLATVAMAQDEFGYACTNCPAAWSNLDLGADVLNNCGGGKQSPIAISKGDARPRHRKKLVLRYGDKVNVIPVEAPKNQVPVNIEWEAEPNGVNQVRFGGRTFNFVQFHFHSAAEHVIDGERSELEMHFVNQASNGSLLVLAVFINAGEVNDVFEPIIESLFEIEAPITVNLRTLLPRKLVSYRYMGSTTTPPCTGGVQWILLKHQVALSHDQIADIQKEIRFLNGGFDNNRTIQNREGRKITKGRKARDDQGDGEDDD